MFTLRFDLRAPEWGAPTEDLYAAAIDMAAWSQDRGAVVAVLSEQHAYLRRAAEATERARTTTSS